MQKWGGQVWQGRGMSKGLGAHKRVAASVYSDQGMVGRVQVMLSREWPVVVSEGAQE